MGCDFNSLPVSLLLSALALAFSLPAQAQVEKAAMRTTGVSCGSCAVFSEVYLKALPGIDKISISMSKEAVMVTYKPGAAFRPKELREALKRTDVGVVQMQISARGHLERRANEAVFVAGRDRFTITSAPVALPIPPDVPIMLEGIVNDLVNPMELKVLSFRPIQAPR
jgi:hypothetical protein